SLAGMILLMPLFATVCLLLKLFNRGRVFFYDERIGKNNKLIRLRRFVLDNRNGSYESETADTKKRKYHNRISSALNIFGMDGIPLLYNVLRGDLSIIGPAPEKPQFVKDYSEEQKQVLKVRPGLWWPYWDLTDLRGKNKKLGDPEWEKYYREVILPEKLKVDLKYAQDQFLGRDMRLLLGSVVNKLKKEIHKQLLQETKSRNILLPLDVILIVFSYFMAYQLRFDWQVPSMEYFIFLKCLPIILFVRIISFYIFGIYKNLWKYVGIKDLIAIISACTVSTAVAIVTIFLFGVVGHSRSIFLIDLVLAISFIGSSRMLIRLFNENIRLEKNERKNVLIIGAGDAGEMVLRMLEINGKGIYNVAGVRHRIVPTVNDLLSGSVHLSKLRKVEISDLFGRQPVHLNLSAIHNFLSGKRVLVTGAGGSIGSELCRQIAEYHPECLILIDKSENYLHEIRCELTSQYETLPLICSHTNITNRNKIPTNFDSTHPNIVFHAAANKHVPLSEENPEEAIWNNVYGTRVVADAASKYNVQSFLMISTDKAVNPTSIMGVTKRIAEIYIQALSRKSQTNFVTVRFGNVLNSNGSVIPIFMKQIEKGGPLTITDPQVERFFMSISEAVQLTLQAITMGNSGEIFILEMGKSIRIMDLALELITQAGMKPFEDIKIKITGLRPGEKMYEELVGKNEQSITTSHQNIKILKSNKIVKLEQIETKIIDLLNCDPTIDKTNLFPILRNLVPEYQPDYIRTGQLASSAKYRFERETSIESQSS
ncbi:MAG: polysaccharide biosynthesis protein, partial [Calditrichota bacterium]